MEESTIRHPPQFLITHADENAFKEGGLRDYSAYRDLGINAATNGLVEAHVIRMIAPFRPELGGRHRHDVQFQMVYCLKGWFETDFDAVGRQRLVAGSCWVQPPNIWHAVVGWSDDCELLEVLMPAGHQTFAAE